MANAVFSRWQMESMKLGKRKKKRRGLKITLWLLILLLVSVLFVAPRVAKQYYNEHGEELIGRKTHLGGLSINYLTGNVSLKDLTIQEREPTDTFLFVERLEIDVDIWSLFGDNYVVESVDISTLKTQITQSGRHFSFDDIILHFSNPADSTETDTTASTSTSFNLESLFLHNSEIAFHDGNAGASWILQKLDISAPEGFSTSKEELKLELSTELASGGSVNANVSYEIEKAHFASTLSIDDFDLKAILPYLQKDMAISALNGNVSTHLTLAGSVEDAHDIFISGDLGLNQVSLVNEANQTLAGIEKLSVKIDSIKVQEERYHLHSLEIAKPFAHFELWKDGDNFSALSKTTTVQPVVDSTLDALDVVTAQYADNVFAMLGHHIGEMVKDLHFTNFSLDTLSVQDIRLEYADKTLIEPFDYSLSNGAIVANGITSAETELTVSISALLNGTGKFDIKGQLNPQQPQNMVVDLLIEDLAMKDLSPYFHYYLGFPIDTGMGVVKSHVTIKDSLLDSENGIDLYAFKLGKKDRHEEAIKLPLKVAVAALKDRKGEIHIEVPVVGNLSDPDYKVGKAVGKIFKELILKAATAPTRAVVRVVKKE